MNKNQYYLILIILLLFGCDQQQNANKSTLESFADSLFQTSVDSSYIAGASVLIFQNGQRLIDKSYGYASLELSVPMPENPSFEIGSVTKQFTAAAILRLVEQEKLSLKDDFTKYLEFDTKGRVITINQLLNHTSGIDSYTEIPDFWKLSIHQYERDSLVRLVEQRDFLFEPGEAMIYNNSAYFFLGLIIEKVSGMSYEDFLVQEFFTPLKMNNTYYCSTSEVIADKVYGYEYSDDGLKQKPYLDHTWPYAAGSLCSTTKDLLIWLRALHNGQLFKNNLYNIMITPDKLNDGSELRYAKGLTKYSNYGNHEISHGGGINGFLSLTSYYPDNNLFIVCLVNTTGPKGAFVDELTWKVLDKKDFESVKIDMELGKIVGDYVGQVRGRKLSCQVAEIPNAITLLYEGQDQPDTLTTYIGNGTWMDGNDIISFADNELIIDQVYGHYILKRK